MPSCFRPTSPSSPRYAATPCGWRRLSSWRLSCIGPCLDPTSTTTVRQIVLALAIFLVWPTWAATEVPGLLGRLLTAEAAFGCVALNAEIDPASFARLVSPETS